MRKVDDVEKKRMLFLVATTSLPAVDRPNDDRWNAARSCQNLSPDGSPREKNVRCTLGAQG